MSDNISKLTRNRSTYGRRVVVEFAVFVSETTASVELCSVRGRRRRLQWNLCIFLLLHRHRDKYSLCEPVFTFEKIVPAIFFICCNQTQSHKECKKTIHCAFVSLGSKVFVDFIAECRSWDTKQGANFK